MNVSDFDYELPRRMIAQTAVEPRDTARLMVLNRADGSIVHSAFHDLPGFLAEGDLLVLNDTRVIPARLFARRATGALVPILLLHEVARDSSESALKTADGHPAWRRGATLPATRPPLP
ncbi:MAG: S-adenosylmethionine:tRNA ribosyltransferase-isomerase, partial [Planctomycetota bacterium]|nr:S-adenosylmethionine:tRNA ribosyltransferase-isomerase [Planctomycetota bacterium]